MGLSAGYLDAHIGEWEQKLKGPAYPHREYWPRYLFLHAPIENAVGILTSGRLLSRNDSIKARIRDVAAVGVIDHSQRAHNFARLYFRPRTPTQYHIEGIRRLGECEYGDNTHAPVLIMLVFDARRVLSLENVRFSPVNMQTGVIEGATEAYFGNIPFDKVYHEGGILGDRSIIAHRCAEVLAPSPLGLEDKLHWIYCRSEAERLTIIHALDSHAGRWEKRILVSDDLKVFEKRFTFVESVSLVNDGVVFRLHPRDDRKPIAIQLDAWDGSGRHCVAFRHDEMPARPPNAFSWQVKAQLKPGVYKVVITLDGHSA